MLFVGIEGGGTKTKLLLQIGEEEPMLTEHNVSLKFSGGRFKESARRLAEMLSQFVLKPDVYQQASIVIGLSGGGRKEDQVHFEQAIKEELPSLSLRVLIMSDAELTLLSAFGETSPGVVLIAGTGSVALIRDPLGIAYRIGGWGKVIGDEGSGYWIGLKAVQYLARVIDRREDPDALATALFATYPILQTEPLKLSYLVESGEVIPSELSHIVFSVAEQSSAARGIIDAAGIALAKLVESAIHHLQGFLPIEVAINGSIATQPLILERITKELANRPIHFRAIADNASVRKALTLAKEWNQD